MASTTLLELYDAIERLNDEQLREVLSVVKGFLVDEEDPIRKRLLRIPGIKLPTQRHPRTSVFKPLDVEGELPSEQIIRERR